MAATRASSALSTAVPSVESASTISPFARAVTSGEPNSPTWACPTFSTTATSGGAMRHRSAMCPTPRAPISITRYLVSWSARSTVSGTPSSLLNEPTGAMVVPDGSSTSASRSLTLVLPCDPVMAMTTGSSWPSTWVASRASASVTSSTTMHGSSTGLDDRTAEAPSASAFAAKSCPSTCSPASATKSPPGCTSRESSVAGAVTGTAPSPWTSPPTAVAMSATLITIMCRPAR